MVETDRQTSTCDNPDAFASCCHVDLLRVSLTAGSLTLACCLVILAECHTLTDQPTNSITNVTHTLVRDGVLCVLCRVADGRGGTAHSTRHGVNSLVLQGAQGA